MAAKYSLTYFAGMGLGEPIRFLLAYGGAHFQDNRIELSDWDKFKSSTPFGQLPVLKVDGKETYQSSAICRYLAKQFDLMGSSDWECLQIDAVIDTFTDFRLEMYKHVFEENEEVKAKKKDKFEKETLPFYLSKLDNIVKENGGYFVGSKLTWADVYFAACDGFFSFMCGKDYLSSYTNLKSVVDKVNGLPKVKAWIEKRPASDW